MKEKTWEKIQRAEKDYHDRKDAAAIRTVNLPYWGEILKRVFPFVPPVEERTRILDIGCGGCGILLAVDKGDKTGVDPLMDFYLEKFPFLRDYPVRWVTGKAEELSVEGSFDIVFMINTLDHVNDFSKALRNAVSRLRRGGALVIVLNCHNTRLFRSYYARFYRFIDHHHPYHFTKEDLIGKLRDLRLLSAENIDSVWLRFSREYGEKVLKKRGGTLRKTLKWGLNPFRYPIAIAKLTLGMPTHATQATEGRVRPIFSLYLFVFQKV